jgi:hypothetical protein
VLIQVAGYLVGCSLSLSKVTAELFAYFCSGKEDVTQAAIRNMVIDLAVRKSFAAKDGEKLCTPRAELLMQHCARSSFGHQHT